ncbi:MAG: hypothetical protein ABI639_16420 [Thermoanaerobaculia bacterium]
MRRRAHLRRAPFAALLLGSLFLAGSLAAYTIRLKDGSELVVKKKYVVQGEKAIVILPSGTESALALSEIDVAKTDAANVNDIGTAIVIENGKATDLAQSAPPPPPRQTLKDLLEKRAAAGGSGTAGAVAIDAAPATAIARPDAGHSGEAPLRNVEISTAIRTFIFGRGITSLEVQQGQSSRRPRLVFETTSETQVFRALQATAGALIEVRDKHPGEVEAFEMVCDAPSGGRACHFDITPPLAADLVAGRIEPPAFFIKYVEF